VSPQAGPLAVSALDAEALAEIAQLERSVRPGLLAQLVGLFEDTGALLLAELDAGLASADAPRIRAAAHSFKSTARNIGAVALGEVCAGIEAAAAQPSPRLRAQVAAAHAEFAASQRALRALLGPPPG
jgi:HPt (histidine-containing phosphotransfer) domain-containing protein